MFATTTSIPVDSTEGFPATGTIKIGNEKISYTGLDATTFTGITRGVDGTTAAASATAALNDDSDTSGTNDLLAAETTINYDGLSNGPLPPKGTILIGSEQITYTSNSGSVLSGLTRGANGTTAASHAHTAAITLLPEVSLVESIEGLGLERRHTLINNTSNITDAATTITVDDTTGFDDNGFLRIENELIQYTGKTATTFTGLTTIKSGSAGSYLANLDYAAHGMDTESRPHLVTQEEEEAVEQEAGRKLSRAERRKMARDKRKQKS